MKFSFRFSNLLGTVYQGGNVEFTPDGNVVASAVGNKLSLFDLKNHCSETLPVEAQYSFSCLSISPNGRTLIAVSEEGRALLIDILARRILHEHRLNHKIPAVKFSPNGRLIAFVKDNGVLIYRAPNISVREYSPFGLERIYQGCYAPSVCAEWSSDSRFLAIGAEDGRITIFPVGKCTQFGIQNVPSHNVSVRGCFFAEKSLDFYSVAENGHLCVWECIEDLDGVVFDNELPRKEEKKPKKTSQEENDEDDVISESEEKEEKEPGPFERKAKHLYKRLARHYLKDLVKNADGKQIPSAVTTTTSYHRRTRMLVTGFSTGDFFLHEMPEANLIHSLNVSSSSPLSASAFSPSGEWLALACKSRGQLVVWEWQSESFILKQEGRLNSLSALAYSADGQYVATGGDDGKLKIWSVITGFCVVTFTEHTSGITGVVYGPGGRTLVSSSLDGTVRAFDTARYRNFRTLTTPTPTQFASVTVDPAGEFACASGLDKFDVYVWSIKTGRLLEVLAGHEAPVSSVFISPAVAGDTVMASCSWDGTLKVWRFLESTMAAETIKLTADATCCVVRPDGMEVAVATLDGVIGFFDISTARQTGSIEGKNDLGSGRKDADLITSKTTGDNKCFTTLCYSSDGNFILAAGQSKHVCIYHVGEGLLVKKFSITRNRSLDAMTEFVNKRRMTELGSLAAMGTRGQGEEFGEGRLALPGVKAGDMASRTFRPEVRVSCVRFAPNGRSWAATTTEGIMVYSLDRNLTFDPYLLEEKVTPARITKTIREQEYGEAIMLALRLNEEPSVIEALESTPPNDIDIISRALPSVYVVKLLDFLSQQLGRTAHLEFYLMWVRSLLWAHSLELKRTQASKGEFAGTVRNLMRNLQRKLTDLGKICDHNKYLTSYLMQVHRCKKERELARDVKKEEEMGDAVVPVAPEFDDDLGVDVLMDDVET